LKGWTLCARAIDAWQAAEPAQTTETTTASVGDAMVFWRSVKFSMRGLSMTLARDGAAALPSAAAVSLG
jgi:hypothetical protein